MQPLADLVARLPGYIVEPADLLGNVALSSLDIEAGGSD